ncbi:MAG: hypothetical protein CL608_34370 [Anaerolineaceae bacterium]|nr:hypothetical protein [Anaerolineaceae bacterium]
MTPRGVAGDGTPVMKRYPKPPTKETAMSEKVQSVRRRPLRKLADTLSHMSYSQISYLVNSLREEITDLEQERDDLKRELDIENAKRAAHSKAYIALRGLNEDLMTRLDEAGITPHNN